MKKFLLGILFTYAVHYSLNLYYEYRFDKAFLNECGVKNGYKGALPERFECVYKEIGVLKPIADTVLARPHYNLFEGFGFYY